MKKIILLGLCCLFFMQSNNLLSIDEDLPIDQKIRTSINRYSYIIFGFGTLASFIANVIPQDNVNSLIANCIALTATGVTAWLAKLSLTHKYDGEFDGSNNDYYADYKFLASGTLGLLCGGSGGYTAKNCFSTMNISIGNSYITNNSHLFEKLIKNQPKISCFNTYTIN